MWMETSGAAGVGAGVVTLHGHCTTRRPILADLPEKASPYTFLTTVNVSYVVLTKSVVLLGTLCSFLGRQTL